MYPVTENSAVLQLKLIIKIIGLSLKDLVKNIFFLFFDLNRAITIQFLLFNKRWNTINFHS